MSQKLRRKLIQFAVCAMTNREWGNFLSGKIYKGTEKVFCAPGLNCYSCPAATLSCPIGALQAVNGTAGFGFGFYAAGFIVAIGALLGRAVCGFLCPFGLFQELIYRIPSPKGHPPRQFTYIKYVVLVILVLLLPNLWVDYAGFGVPAFCQYICPAGTLEGALPLLATHSEFRQAAGWLFLWKAFLLIAVVVGSMIVYRFFCKTLCPLGAVYGLLNRVSLYGLQVDAERCRDCGECSRICRMGVNPTQFPNSAECIRCGDCEAVCPHGAIRLGMSHLACSNKSRNDS